MTPNRPSTLSAHAKHRSAMKHLLVTIALLLTGCATPHVEAVEPHCKFPPIGSPKAAALAQIEPCWGKPFFNQTFTAGHVNEQAVFGDSVAFMYFDNGLLTSIQQ